MMNQIGDMKLEDWKMTKVGCWRNTTVKQYTDFIRKALGFKEEYEPNDLIMMASPMTDANGRIVAYTDEEFQIHSIEERTITVEEGTIDARAITLKDSRLKLLVPYDWPSFNQILTSRGGKASRAEDGMQRKILWRRYWELKNQFQQIRHGYAMTAHRLQGTTLDSIYVDRTDVLANHNTREAYRALYVLATRPKNRFITF
jgi:hypothetical protein